MERGRRKKFLNVFFSKRKLKNRLINDRFRGSIVCGKSKFFSSLSRRELGGRGEILRRFLTEKTNANYRRFISEKGFADPERITLFVGHIRQFLARGPFNGRLPSWSGECGQTCHLGRFAYKSIIRGKTRT